MAGYAPVSNGYSGDYDGDDVDNPDVEDGNDHIDN